MKCITIFPNFAYFSSVAACESSPLHYTTGDSHYHYDFGVLESATTQITFDVRAAKDVYIILSPQDYEIDEVYEIVIGGWNNRKSAIRRCHGNCEKAAVSQYQAGFLDSQSFRSFWIIVRQQM